MKSADHSLTSSYRNSLAAQQYRQGIDSLVNENRFRDAMALEIMDVKRIIETKYNKAMQKMLESAKKNSYLDRK